MTPRLGGQVRLSDPPAGWSDVRGEVILIDHVPNRPTQAMVRWDNGETVYELLDRISLT
jgi:hypothetical protein